MTAYITFLLSMRLSVAFRADCDYLELFKSLPIRSPAIAAGQLMAVAAQVTALQAAVFFVVGTIFPASGPLLVAATVFAIQVNLLNYGIEDCLFLWYPTRLQFGRGANFLQAGRMMLFLLVKGVALVVCCGAAFSAGGLVFWLTDSLLLAGFVSWCVLIPASVGVVILVAHAFDRLDLATDHGD